MLQIQNSGRPQVAKRFDAQGQSQDVIGFRELLAHILQLDSQTGTGASQLSQPGILLTGLLSAHLQLDIQFVGFERLQDLGPDQELEVQLLRTGRGLLLRFAAVTAHGGDAGPAEGASAGGIFTAASAGTAGQVLWDFRTTLDSASSDSERREQISGFLKAAEQMIEYLNELQMLQSIARSSNEHHEKKAAAEREAEAVKASINKALDLKRQQLDWIAKEWLKRYQTQNDLQKLQLAKRMHQRLQHFVGSAEKQLSQPMLEPGQIAGLLCECESLRHQLSAVLAFEVSIQSAPTS